MSGSVRCIKYLLSIGANPNYRYPRTGETPLHLSFYSGNNTVSRLLLARVRRDRTRSQESQVWLDAMHRIVASATRPYGKYYVDTPNEGLNETLTNELAYLGRTLVPFPSDGSLPAGPTIRVHISMETSKRAFVRGEVRVLPGVGWVCTGEAHRVGRAWVFLFKSVADIF